MYNCMCVALNAVKLDVELDVCSVFKKALDAERIDWKATAVCNDPFTSYMICDDYFYVFIPLYYCALFAVVIWCIFHCQQYNWFDLIFVKFNNLNFHPLEVVARYHNPQLQSDENYSYLFNVRPNICKSWCLNAHFVPNNCDWND